MATNAWELDPIISSLISQKLLPPPLPPPLYLPEVLNHAQDEFGRTYFYNLLRYLLNNYSLFVGRSPGRFYPKIHSHLSLSIYI